MKWSLTGGGRLREVVAMRELTVLDFHFLNQTRNNGELADPCWSSRGSYRDFQDMDLRLELPTFRLKF